MAACTQCPVRLRGILGGGLPSNLAESGCGCGCEWQSSCRGRELVGDAEGFKLAWNLGIKQIIVASNSACTNRNIFVICMNVPCFNPNDWGIWDRGGGA
ncbi:hypothetical protein Ancab_019161 [Ancistrocladus abbreviatus]